MKTALAELNTEPYTAERTWTVENIPVLTAALSLPQPVSHEGGTARRVKRYYRLQARCFLRYCERFLLPQAAAEYRAALASSTALPHFRAQLDYRVTYNRGGFWSLYTQSREVTLPGQTLLTRRGDTWDLAAGYPVPLSAFFPARSPWKRQLTALAGAEIQRQERDGTARYRTDWRRQLRRSFDPRSFYLTADGLAFFYPMYALAPAAEGIPTFLLPYSPEGPLSPAPPEAQAEPPS